MLYDPKWEVKTKPGTVADLIAWLETQPNRSYDYSCPSTCLLAQYYAARGEKMYIAALREQGTPIEAGDTDRYRLEWLAREKPRTFSAALTRARELAARHY